MNASDGDTVQAEAAHEEYLSEVRQLVDQQVVALFQMIAAAASQIGANADRGSQGGTPERDNRTLTVSSGGRTATFTVEAVTDLPEGADRAQEFPAGQARCTVSNADGTTDQWVLHRVGESGETQPQYAWVRSNSEAPLDEARIAELLQSALGNSPTSAMQDQAGADAATSLGHEADSGAVGQGNVIPVDGNPRTIESNDPAV